MKLRALFFIVLFLMAVSVQVQAQADEFEVITADNAAQLQEIARYGDGLFTRTLAWAPDENTLAVGGTLGVWLYDDDSPRLLPSESVEDVAFHPDGSVLAAIGQGVLYVWESNTWEQTAQIVFNPEDGALVSNLQYRDTLVFSPDGSQLAVGGYNGAWIFDTRDYQNQQLLPLPDDRDAHVLGLSFQTLATENAPILLVDVERNFSTCGEGLFDAERYAFRMSDFSEVEDFPFDDFPVPVEVFETPTVERPVSAHLWAAHPTWIGIYDGADTQWLDGSTGEIMTLPTLPPLPSEGRYFYNSTLTAAAQVIDENVVFWRRSDGTPIDLHLDTFDLVRPPYFSPDGHIIVLRKIPSESAVRVSVNLYDVESNVEQHLFDFQGTPIDDMSVILDRLELNRENGYALTFERNLTRLWDTSTGEIIPLPENASLSNGIEGANVINEAEALLAYHIEYAWGAYELGLFDLDAYETKGIFHLDNTQIRYYQFNEDWSRLVMVGAPNYDCQANRNDVGIWDTETQTLLNQWQTEFLSSLIFDPSETLLIGGATLGDVLLWDASTGELLVTLRGHQGGIRNAYITADRTRLLTESGDGTVRMWGVPVD